MSTHSQSSSWFAMISAENELGIESPPPSAGLSCCHNRFTAFSRIPFPPGCCPSDCSPVSRPQPAVNAAPGGRSRLWYPLAERTCPEPACRPASLSKEPPPCPDCAAATPPPHTEGRVSRPAPPAGRLSGADTGRGSRAHGGARHQVGGPR